MNKSKAKGTSWESAIVELLTRLGFDARRVVLHGNEDQGDIHIEGLPIVIEAKNEKTYKIPEWIAEANAEALNAEERFGVVWAHRKGKASPEDGFVLMDGVTFTDFLLYLKSKN
jgi:hypothetical protein